MIEQHSRTLRRDLAIDKTNVSGNARDLTLREHCLRCPIEDTGRKLLLWGATENFTMDTSTTRCIDTSTTKRSRLLFATVSLAVLARAHIPVTH